MQTIRRGLLSLALVLGATSAASAHWSVGVRVGLPIYVGPYPYYGYGYYRPYPYPYPYYAAPPVIVQQAPVVTTTPGPAYPPPPASVPSYSPPSAAPAEVLPPPTATPVARGVPAAETDGAWGELNSSDERLRAAAMMQLGRRKERRAIEPLTRALREDRSPAAREAAARALGLIGAPASLTALQNAAQADEDRDVRRSASFAAEVIRANLRP